MSPAHVFPPTYEEIKRRLMAGVWPSGFKLEAMQLANDLGVSMSPVRDSLNRLMGERIVEAVAGQGFCVARFDEQGLRDLLDFAPDMINSVRQDHIILLNPAMRGKGGGDAQHHVRVMAPSR